MMDINRLKIRLPSALREQAGEFTRLLARELSSVTTPSDFHVDKLQLKAIEYDPSKSLQYFARQVSVNIQEAIKHSNGELRS